MPHTETRFTVEATAAAVHEARHRLNAEVRAWGCPDDQELFFRLDVVAAELLNNGLQHAGHKSMTLEASLEDSFLVVGVLDHSPAAPRSHEAGADDEYGRGLTLIEGLSMFHGMERTADGKRCWAAFPATAAPAPPLGDTSAERLDDTGGPVDERWSVTTAGRKLLAGLFTAT
ncbi:ATP-binding protein [Streptomyces anandii]|uniref:ATP-binding protein n=1 Tax=Streptomyces anandii TaxID=285454 RepID=A0ABW6H9Y5_9ACTN